jgi:serine/threonine-protein kinase
MMHRAGYVHRDVKPRNVLIAGSGHVYLSDFGLARQVVGGTGVTRAGQWVGSVDFIAPEQVRGGRADAKADIYGLGGVLHFALTGRPPYEHETDEAKLRAHLFDRPPSPSSLQAGVPRSVDAVVARALAKEPAQRYSSAAELGRSALIAASGAETFGSERSVTRAASCPEREMRDVDRDGASTVRAPHAAPSCESRRSRPRSAEPMRSWTRW